MRALGISIQEWLDLANSFAYTESGSKTVKFGGAGATQHSQINRSELVDWPVLQLQHRPVWVDSLDATLDIVQVEPTPIHLGLAPERSCDCQISDLC